MYSRFDGETRDEAHALRRLSLSADDVLHALLRLSPQRRLSVLDSCAARSAAARLLIAGFDPLEVIEARGRRIEIARRGEKKARVLTGDVLDLLEARLDEYSAKRPDNVPQLGGGACIATISYDLCGNSKHQRYGIQSASMEEPDAVLAFYDTLVIHDYVTNETKIVTRGGERRLDETARVLEDSLARSADSFSCLDDDFDAKPVAPRAVHSNLTREEYLASVLRIKEHIAAGDIYQANYTQRFTCELAPEMTPETVFWRLRRDHPAPFAAFMRRGEDAVVSASPERFLRVLSFGCERRVEAWPIKGTRPRGASPEEDERLRAELTASEKDRAENVMIVDLLRNDLGRVCRYGSIEVAELCALEEHPTLFHLVSKVRGVLGDDVRAGALLRAAFPCGSITGAPKIRAMEIIAETETVKRGLSMGAIGYFGFDGSIDLNVAIRTMVVKDCSARFNVGGGIVADSCPEQEYEESLVKARALLKALGVRSV